MEENEGPRKSGTQETDKGGRSLVKVLSRFITSLLDTRAFKSDDELYLYLITYGAVLFTTFVHFGLTAMFLLAGVPIMVVANAAYLLLLVACAFIVQRKNHFKAAGYLMSFMVMVYTSVTIWLIGNATYSFMYFMLVFILQFIMPYTRYLGRFFVCMILLACVFSTAIVGLTHQPLIVIDGAIEIALLVYNILLSLAGIAASLTIITTAKKVIAAYNVKRLDEMTDAANSDALTGLYNRRFAHRFFDSIKRGRQDAQWVVALLDVDDFKRMNDRYGHLAGDIVLVDIAGTMKRSLRKSDMIFRWGGEEFLLLLKDAQLGDAMYILDNLRKRIEEQKVDTDGVELAVTVTIGACVVDLQNLEESINKCDQKMYEGKKNGKNQVVI